MIVAESPGPPAVHHVLLAIECQLLVGNPQPPTVNTQLPMIHPPPTAASLWSTDDQLTVFGSCLKAFYDKVADFVHSLLRTVFILSGPPLREWYQFSTVQ